MIVLVNFPRRIYTLDEFDAARKAIALGKKHHLRVRGSSEFKRKVEEILVLIKVAGYSDLLRKHIRCISEVEGVSQLREADSAIWLNLYVVKEPFEGARFVIHKAEQMMYNLEGKLNYIDTELQSVKQSVEFLERLENNLKDSNLKEKCKEVLSRWKEDKVL